MKKISSIFFYINTLLLVVTFSACKPNLPDNYFMVNDDTHEINTGFIINNGEAENGFNIDLQLVSGDGTNFVSFGIVSQQAEALASKTYTKFDGIWVLGYESSSNYSEMAKMSNGSIIIDRQADGYTIEFQCVDQYGNDIKGYYKGVLLNKDENNVVHEIPDYVIPEEIYDSVAKYFPIYDGIDIPNINGQYLSSPHVLVYQSDSKKPDSLILYSDRFVSFMSNHNGQMNFYGKQYDPEQNQDIEEIYYNVKISGSNNCFTCYYVIDGYPNGYYAQQSFLFSGEKTEEGIKDFHTAVILLETSGHPNLPPKNTFRVLKDNDGIAYNEEWLSKSPAPRRSSTNNNVELFEMWMK